ncbi:MAG: histidine kinase [Nitrospinae bacterium CG22_combo_CG10-13_8_21_14_all_47_10]|nr:MAG: histidine kinase [Nitrospinae bacterium CG22_combo_CG10-13_8_21_14_all_47_10]
MGEEISYIKEFLDEIAETLGRLDSQFVTLEKNPSDKDCLTKIFRDLHTIKGSCGLLGLNKLESITHSGENLLGKLRDGKLTLKPVMVTNLLGMMDAIWKTVACLKKDGQEGPADYSTLIENLALLEKSQLPPGEPEKTLPHASTPPAEHLKACIDDDSRPDGVLTAETANYGDLAHKAGDKEGPVVGSSEGTNIRVDVELLDSLMNLVGEVVLARNQFTRIIQSSDNTAILGTSQSLNRVTTDLQETVMKARMQPIKNVWDKLPRMVRDISMTCGNKIRLEMEGQDSDLDKSLITAIQDPIMNIIRNAIAHGIETPEERRKLGKPEEGVIRLRAFNQSGQIHIEVQDDGRGVDLQAVKKKAVDEKRITPEQGEVLNDKDCGKLLFMRGFSMTKNSLVKPTKGDGLAHTRTLVEKIGGALDIEIQPAKFTTLKIKIPLTLAIIPALIISSGSNRFAIPQINIRELIRLEGEQNLKQIEEIAGRQFYRLRGNLLPLVHFNQILKTDNHGHRPDLNIVVLQTDDLQFGLVVEQIYNSEEIVVKNLENLLKNIEVFSGVTIMGNGEIVLILDVTGLAQNSLMVPGEREELVKPVSSSQSEDGETQTLLIVNLSNTREMAIQLSDVTRLEEIKMSDLEIAGEEYVVQYRGEIMPLIDIPKLFNEPNSLQKTRDKLEVVVHTREGKSLGLIVERILDIVKAKINPKRANPALNRLGTIITNDSVIDVLDIKTIVEEALKTGLTKNTLTNKEVFS